MDFIKIRDSLDDFMLDKGYERAPMGGEYKHTETGDTIPYMVLHDLVEDITFDESVPDELVKRVTGMWPEHSEVCIDKRTAAKIEPLLDRYPNMNIQLEEDDKADDAKYLFVCDYAQSRSKWFAERFMEFGRKAMFAGWVKEDADFPLTKEHLEWTDVIVLLDKDIKRQTDYDAIVGSGKRIIEHFIEDEPQYFDAKFEEMRRLYKI